MNNINIQCEDFMKELYMQYTLHVFNMGYATIANIPSYMCVKVAQN